MARFNTLSGVFFFRSSVKNTSRISCWAGSVRSMRRFIKLQNLTQISVNEYRGGDEDLRKLRKRLSSQRQDDDVFISIINKHKTCRKTHISLKHRRRKRSRKRPDDHLIRR